MTYSPPKWYTSNILCLSIQFGFANCGWMSCTLLFFSYINSIENRSYWLWKLYVDLRMLWWEGEIRELWTICKQGSYVLIWFCYLYTQACPFLYGLLQIKNLSAMEVNIVRPFIRRALQAFCKHDSPELIPDPERVADKRPQLVNNAPRVCFHFFYIIIFL